jgi:signal transduction histidine kinase
MLDMHSRDHYVDQKIIEEKNAAMQALLDKAEAANRAKSEFLTNMSHELRTPLNAIIGFSEIIRQEYLGPVGSPKYMDYATDIHLSGKHLLTIINDILDLARAESGQLAIREQVFDLRELVGAVHAQLAGQALEAGLDLTVEMPGENVTARGDQRLLRQVLLNIVSNAVKFTPSGGRVAVIMDADCQEGIRIIVRDTGVGIPPEHIERVLRPFEQVENALSRSHGGAGLGLSFALKVIELHEGTLTIDSAVGTGTTVRVMLPPSRLDAAEDGDDNIRTLDLA